MLLCEMPTCLTLIPDRDALIPGPPTFALSMHVGTWEEINGVRTLRYHTHKYCSKRCLSRIEDKGLWFK